MTRQATEVSSLAALHNSVETAILHACEIPNFFLRLHKVLMERECGPLASTYPSVPDLYLLRKHLTLESVACKVLTPRLNFLHQIVELLAPPGDLHVELDVILIQLAHIIAMCTAMWSEDVLTPIGVKTYWAFSPEHINAARLAADVHVLSEPICYFLVTAMAELPRRASVDQVREVARRAFKLLSDQPLSVRVSPAQEALAALETVTDATTGSLSAADVTTSSPPISPLITSATPSVMLQQQLRVRSESPPNTLHLVLEPVAAVAATTPSDVIPAPGLDMLAMSAAECITAETTVAHSADLTPASLPLVMCPAAYPPSPLPPSQQVRSSPAPDLDWTSPMCLVGLFGADHEQPPTSEIDASGGAGDSANLTPESLPLATCPAAYSPSSVLPSHQVHSAPAPDLDRTSAICLDALLGADHEQIFNSALDASGGVGDYDYDASDGADSTSIPQSRLVRELASSLRSDSVPSQRPPPKQRV